MTLIRTKYFKFKDTQTQLYCRQDEYENAIYKKTLIDLTDWDGIVNLVWNQLSGFDLSEEPKWEEISKEEWITVVNKLRELCIS